MVLAVCAVAAVGYVARDFLIPTAGAIVLALMLTPVANPVEPIRLPVSLAAAASVLLLTLLLAGLLAVAVPSISNWAEQAPFLTLTLERKLEGLRKSLAIVQEVSNRVEQAASATASSHPAQPPAEKVVVSQHSLLGVLASTTPGVVLQIGYAGVLAFMLLAHRNTHRRQVLRIPVEFATRVRLARTMRDINERVGHYLFALAAIYSCVAVVAAVALAALGFPNAIVWGAGMGLASFLPFGGPPVVIGLVGRVGIITRDDWPRIVAAPAPRLRLHSTESRPHSPPVCRRLCRLAT